VESCRARRLHVGEHDDGVQSAGERDLRLRSLCRSYVLPSTGKVLTQLVRPSRPPIYGG
jgi:hypothetical protein